MFEVFDHNSFVDPGGDGWQTISKQGRSVANPPTARKFRIRDLTSASPLGARRGYEVELPQNTGLDQYSSGDVWATVYRGDSVQQGPDVGADCTDRVLENVYAQGPLDTSNGSDTVFWVAARKPSTCPTTTRNSISYPAASRCSASAIKALYHD